MPSSRGTDVWRAFAEDGPCKTHIGGQALIEGVMMRGKDAWALAVAKPDGTFHEEMHPLKDAKHPAWTRVPFVRGSFALFDSLALGFKALEIAASHAFEEESSEGSADGTASLSHAEMVASLLIGTLLAVALFMFLPALVSQLAVGDYSSNPLAWNLIDGVARAAVFVTYVWAIGRVPDIKRMFAYHGAEHKTIHCHEHGLPLTPANARAFPRLHVRCGTAFLVMTILVAIVVYSVVPFGAAVEALGVEGSVQAFVVVLGLRLLLLPVIAGVSYEVTVKWAGSHPESRLVKAVLWPGLQMQRLTTGEPDDVQLLCAVRAMQQVLDHEKAPQAPSSPCGKIVYPNGNCPERGL